MQKIIDWLKTTPFKDYKLEQRSVESDKKYYRLVNNDKTLLLMDASSNRESLVPFINTTYNLTQKEVGVPQILAENLEDGFLVIDDFGDDHYIDILTKKNYQSFYKKAIEKIIEMQNADTQNLPIYDEKLLDEEMKMMEEWYINKLLRRKLSSTQKEIMTSVIEIISKVILSQPQGLFVHHDFHSKNIVLKDEEIVIVDYHDAMSGFLTYDLVSLLKDSFIAFDENEMSKLALYFRDQKGLEISDSEFLKWFDFMGMQRHIKMLGEAGKNYVQNDQKECLQEVPLTLQYLFDTAKKYEETKSLTKLLKEL